MAGAAKSTHQVCGHHRVVGLSSRWVQRCRAGRKIGARRRPDFQARRHRRRHCEAWADRTGEEGIPVSPTSDSAAHVTAHLTKVTDNIGRPSTSPSVPSCGLGAKRARACWYAGSGPAEERHGPARRPYQHISCDSEAPTGFGCAGTPAVMVPVLSAPGSVEAGPRSSYASTRPSTGRLALRGRTTGGGDHVFFQGHASPKAATLARFIEGVWLKTGRPARRSRPAAVAAVTTAPAWREDFWNYRLRPLADGPSTRPSSIPSGAGADTKAPGRFLGDG